MKAVDGEIELKLVLSAALQLTDRYYWDSAAYASGEMQSRVMTVGDSKTGKRYTVTVQEIPRELRGEPLFIEGQWGEEVKE